MVIPLARLPTLQGYLPMRKLLLASVAFAALAFPAQAAVISPLGVNPTSAAGHFSNDVFGTTFEDQYTFSLTGGPQFVTIASATNVYSAPADFISSFAGQLFLQVGAVDPDGVAGDDIGFGLISAVACPTDPLGCQNSRRASSARRGELLPGNYRHGRGHGRLRGRFDGHGRPGPGSGHGHPSAPRRCGLVRASSPEAEERSRGACRRVKACMSVWEG